MGFGSAPSGLALTIRFAPLKSATERHRTPYGDASRDLYELCLMFDEMVIDGQELGTKWNYGQWKFKWGWHDAMPQALGELFTNLSTGTGGKQFISVRTATELIPGVDPEEEKKRLEEEQAAAQQVAAEGAALANGNGNANNLDLSFIGA